MVRQDHPASCFAEYGILLFMGKVHRIKKHFWKIMSQKPLPVGDHYLAHTTANIYINRRFHDGSYYVMQWGSHYKPLVNKLIQEYKDTSRDSSSDRSLLITENKSEG